MENPKNKRKIATSKIVKRQRELEEEKKKKFKKNHDDEFNKGGGERIKNNVEDGENFSGL